jgi:serine/threonine-protein kinase
MIGEFGEALVMDWGVASGAGSEADVAGTPAYMAPEQAKGERVDARADVWSLGAILFFILARRPPEPVDPAAPKPLVSICRKAMAADPADRYSTALELADDVRSFLDALPVRAHRESLLERTARFASRHRVVLSLLGAYLLVRMLIALVG